MRKKELAKIFTKFSVLALSAMMVFSFGAAGCKKGGDSGNGGDGGDGGDGGTTVTEGKTYYVSTTGSANGDGSESNPYDIYTLLHNSGSIESSILKPGDTVLVQPGTYSLSQRIVIDYSGAYNNPITIKNADPEQDAVISFYKMNFLSTNRGVEIKGNYIVWDGVDICGAGDNGMYIGGSYNTVLNSEFYDNRDTGLQLGRSESGYNSIEQWPSYNLIKNCTSYNNYDNETYGENADGFAAKLTVGYHNVFDGCIAYRNSDDGWDLYAKTESGNIGCVIMYNCVAFENGYLLETQEEFNSKFETYNSDYDEANTNVYSTRDGDGNGFKLGGGTMEGDVILENCLSFNNRMHGVTDNSNPGTISVRQVTSYNNSALVDTRSHTNIVDENGKTSQYYNAIGSDGYILYSDNEYKTVYAIVDESGVCKGKSVYASLDDNGYIKNSEGSYVDADGNSATDPQIKGTYVKAKQDGQTENESFGNILQLGQDTMADHGNIDLARDGNSYNNLSEVLSINNNANGVDSDRYKGSVEYSFFSVSGGKTAYKIGEAADAENAGEKASGTKYLGESVAAPSATEIFAALPEEDMGMSREIHEIYRNDDGSVNMGDVLRIKDYSLLFGDEHKIGCDLSKSSWNDYAHYAQSDLTAFDSEDEAIMQAIKDSLYVPADTRHVYQDFNVLTKMYGATIAWTSSDSNVLKVTQDYGPEPSISQLEYVRIEVYRQSEVKTVNLTAEITYKGITEKVDIGITVAEANPFIGGIEVEDVQDGVIIKNKNENYKEPDLIVYDGSDYNGKILNESLYNVTSKYMHAPDANSQFTEISPIIGFSTGTAGVYEITKTVTLKSNPEDSASYTYRIYVVDANGDIDFVGEPSLSVNKVGFIISGELSNVSGSVYAMVTDEDVTADTLKAEGTEVEIFGDKFNHQFENENSGAYTVKFGVFNPNGKLTSEIYSVDVGTVNISTLDEFHNLAVNGGDANKIYLLQNDLDFSDYAWTVGQSGFVGLLNGQGYTVKGITSTATKDGDANVFSSLKGGTIMNITFEDIRITNSGTKVGIIAEAYGGYLYNIKLKNIFVLSNSQRAGSLVGQALEASMPLYIDRVSLINDRDDTGVFADTQRAGGIVGFIQATSAPTLDLEVYISNCFVDATIEGTSGQAGGIVGTYDTQKTTINFTLEISNCYFAGVCKSGNRAGGILGYQQGVGKLRITNCLNYGDLYHAGSTAPITVAEKNCSGIIGGYVTTADCIITNCFAKFEEHNADYGVSVVPLGRLQDKSFWVTWMFLDMENIWEYIESPDNENLLVGTFVTLR